MSAATAVRWVASNPVTALRWLLLCGTVAVAWGAIGFFLTVAVRG